MTFPSARGEPGELDDHLRVQGVKITLDNGWGTIVHWDPAELVQAIGDGRDEPSGPLSQLAGIEAASRSRAAPVPQLSAWGR